MVTLYVVSSQEAAGKTVICAGIGRYLMGAGKDVGFLKVLSGSTEKSDDAVFMKQILTLPEVAGSLMPLISDIATVKETGDRVSQGKDVVIVEGILGESPDDDLSRASYELAKALNARVIIVEAYSSQPPQFVDSYHGFGENLLGVILNKVPGSQAERLQEEASAQFGKAGINVLGVVPEDRVLSALTTGELADCIHGKILNDTEKSAELVENFMLGAMVVDSGLEYFGRKSNKAAVVRGDRPDMQVAALETSTRCLVLSDSTELPIHSVQQKAENRGIPIIQTEQDANTIVTGIEKALGEARFNQEMKLPKLAEIIKQHVNLQAVA
ncbi:DRTGG domain-containing protein [Chloroflexota bacterium]